MGILGCQNIGGGPAGGMMDVPPDYLTDHFEEVFQ
jgi:hypothetical protein